jgi:hypothetical protein
MPEVVPEYFEPCFPYRGSNVMLDRICAAHLDTRGTNGFFRRHAAALFVRRGRFDEGAKFFIHLALDCAFPKERPQTLNHIGTQTHFSSLSRREFTCNSYPRV